MLVIILVSNDATLDTAESGARTMVSSLAIKMSAPINPTTDQYPPGAAGLPCGPDTNLILFALKIVTMSSCFNNYNSKSKVDLKSYGG